MRFRGYCSGNISGTRQNIERDATWIAFRSELQDWWSQLHRRVAVQQAVCLQSLAAAAMGALALLHGPFAMGPHSGLTLGRIDHHRAGHAAGLLSNAAAAMWTACAAA